MSLFVKKPLAGLIAESKESGEHTLKRTLGAWGLVALGIGADEPVINKRKNSDFSQK